MREIILEIINTTSKDEPGFVKEAKAEEYEKMIRQKVRNERHEALKHGGRRWTYNELSQRAAFYFQDNPGAREQVMRFLQAVREEA